MLDGAKLFLSEHQPRKTESTLKNENCKRRLGSRGFCRFVKSALADMEPAKTVKKGTVFSNEKFI